MMTNLFSIFDPSSSLMSISWSLILIIPIIMSKSSRKLTSPLIMGKSKMIFTLKKEISFTMKSQNKKQEGVILSLFIVIMLMNVTALYPENFSLTSHLVITLPISMIMWLSVIMFGWTKHTNHMLSHLLPQGTPVMLMNFMVLIEMTSNAIRPITLCVRLTANLIAGHLLMTLLGNALMSCSFELMTVTSIFPMILTVLESAVSLIQAYVFMTLITLYVSETK